MTLFVVPNAYVKVKAYQPSDRFIVSFTSKRHVSLAVKVRAFIMKLTAIQTISACLALTSFGCGDASINQSASNSRSIDDLTMSSSENLDPAACVKPCRIKPGSLDTRYSGDGIVAIDFNFGDPAKAHDVLTDAISLPAGGLLLAGTTTIEGNDDPFYVRSSITRLRPNGQLDPSFGTGGKATRIFENVAYGGGPVSLGLQGSKVIVAGGGTSHVSVALTRLLSDGSIDRSFGDSSFGVDGFSAVGEFNTTDLIVQRDGKIIVTTSSRGNPYSGAFMARRYLPDGAPDFAFGNNLFPGYLILLEGAESTNTLEQQPDQKILVGTSSFPGSGTGNAGVVIRTTKDGQLDRSFGSGGVVTDSTMGPIKDIALQSNGYILATDGLVLLRLNPNGTIDTSFGSQGKKYLGPLLAVSLTSISVLPNNFIYIGGIQTDSGIVIRLTKNGQFDTTFGRQGVAHLPPRLFPTIVNHDFNGNALASGSVNGQYTGWDFFTAKLLGNCIRW